MIIKVNQAELMKAINIVQKAVASQTTMPILKCIYIIANEGRLTLVANDMQIGIETYIEAKVIESGSVVVDSRLFGDIVRNIHDELINIQTDEHLTVNIKCENLDVNLKGFSDIDFPKLPQVEENQLITVQENILSHMINQTLFAVAATDYIQIINGQLIEVKENRLIMAASDGFRFALREQQYSNDNNLEGRIVVPGDSLKEIRKLLNNESICPIKIAFEDNHAVFFMDRTKVVTRLLQGDYIKFESLIPKQYATEMKVNKKEFLEALAITSVFADKIDGAVILRVTNNNLEVYSNSEIGNVSKNLSVENTGEDLEIGFDIKYLIDGIKVIDGEEFNLSFVGGARAPAVISSFTNSKYKYLISPKLVSGIR